MGLGVHYGVPFVNAMGSDVLGLSDYQAFAYFVDN